MITLADLPSVLTGWLGALIDSPRLLMVVMMVALVLIGTALDLTPAILIFALAAPLAAMAQDVKPRLIRFGYGPNEQSNQGRAVRLFAEQVEKNSGGKPKVRAVGAAAFGPDVQTPQALIGGAQEMMACERRS
jgi:TRAP-type C4-dicarboxylate transport system substrate-binding protein